MKIINFILDLFRLFYLSIYKRTKGLNAKSRFFALMGYILIINMFFNFYLISFLINKDLIDNSNKFIFGKINFIILAIYTAIIIFFDFKFKKDKRFIFKYRKIITHNVFEYILFVLFFIFVLIVTFFDENAVF